MLKLWPPPILRCVGTRRPEKSMSDKKERNRDKEAPRGTHYYADPDDLVIIGLDTDDGPEHPLYDPRIKGDISEPEIRNVEYFGIITPVQVRRYDNRLEVVNGRGRVRKARLVK